MRYRTVNRYDRLILAAAAGVLIAAAFAMGVTTQRVENRLALEDACTQAPDGIGCLIVLDRMK